MFSILIITCHPSFISFILSLMTDKNEESTSEVHDKLGKDARELKKQIAAQMLTLATSGFGLVAALAWNEFIQSVVNEVIKPLIGESSGVISQLIYAVIVTILAVVVTYNLSKFVERKELNKP
jgi:uncharacterized membrane protein